MFTGLRCHGVEVDVVCEPDAPARRDYEEAGLDVTPVAVRRRIDFAAYRVVRALAENRRYDVVHMMTRRTLRHGIPAARRIGAAAIGYRGVIGRLHPWNPADRSTVLSPHLARIVAVSDAVRGSLLEPRWPGLRLDPDRVVTIHKGHDVGWYDEPPIDRADFGVPAGAFLVAFVANLRKGKAVGDVLEAFERLPASLGAYLLMVGEGTDAPPVLGRVAASPAAGRIRALGRRPSAFRYSAAADTLVLASRADGLSKVVIEAMASRVPPIVTPAAGGGELVRHEVEGLVVPFGDPEALASAMARLAGDAASRTALGAAARRRIVSDFSVEQTVRKTAALYEDVLREPRVPASP